MPPDSTIDAETADALTSDALPAPASGVAPTVPPVEVEIGGTAAALIEPYVAVASEALGGPDSRDLSRVAAVVEGEALDALRILLDEFDDNGWTQIGIARVVSSEVLAIDVDGDPPTAVISACVDQSEVEIVDADGISLIDENAPKRALNEFTLQFLDDRWAVTYQTFPVDTSC